MTRQTSRFSTDASGLHLGRIRPLALGLLAVSAFLTSCGGGVTGGGGSSGDPAGGGDNGNPGAGGGLTVAISTPASTVHTHGIVAIQVSVSGGTPDSVELLKDSTLLAPLSPPYQYNWDTASTPDGSYQLVARATKGNQSFTSAPRTVVVETHLAITSRVPAPNATNVSVDDPILVVFTQPLLPTSVVPAAFALRSGSTPVPTTPLLSGDGKTVMLLRHTSLSAPAILTLTVSSSITDLGGHTLPGAETWSWSVPDWLALGGPVNAIPGRGVEQSYPTLTLERTGNPVVAFSEYNGTLRNVYVERWTGSDWQLIGGPVNAVAGQNAIEPVLALDTRDRPVVAFRESDGTHSNVYVQQWTGTGWQSVGGRVNAVADQSVDELPVMALDGNDRPVVAFTEIDRPGTDGVRNVYVYRWTGHIWQPVGSPVNALPPQNAWGPPALALDRNGSLIVAFSEYDGTYGNIYVQHWSGRDDDWRPVGGAIRHPTSLSAAAPALALDRNGRLVVAFSSYDGSNYSVCVQRWTGSNWQSVGDPVNPWPFPHPPVVALDGSGNPLLASQKRNEFFYVSVSVQQWTGADWHPVGGLVNAVPGQHVLPFLPALALDGSSKPVVAFVESDGTRPNLYVRRINQ